MGEKRASIINLVVGARTESSVGAITELLVDARPSAIIIVITMVDFKTSPF
jgi:hypothetical protein